MLLVLRRARKVAQHFTFGASREGGACFVSEKSVHGSQFANGLCVFLPLCQRSFRQAPQIGGGVW